MSASGNVLKTDTVGTERLAGESEARKWRREGPWQKARTGCARQPDGLTRYRVLRDDALQTQSLLVTHKDLLCLLSHLLSKNFHTLTPRFGILLIGFKHVYISFI